MTEPSGSFPIMQIAKAAGADYGDVLRVAYLMREFKHGNTVPRGRARTCMDAGNRIMNQIGGMAYGRKIVGPIVARL